MVREVTQMSEFERNIDSRLSRQQKPSEEYNKDTLESLQDRIRFLEEDNEVLENKVLTLQMNHEQQIRNIQDGYAVKYDQLEQENSQLVIEYEERISNMLNSQNGGGLEGIETGQPVSYKAI